MLKNHAVHPNSNDWDCGDDIRCFFCNEPIMEAVYTGGWMHKVKEQHEHLPFVYSDGVVKSPGFCILCGVETP